VVPLEQRNGQVVLRVGRVRGRPQVHEPVALAAVLRLVGLVYDTAAVGPRTVGGRARRPVLALAVRVGEHARLGHDVRAPAGVVEERAVARDLEGRELAALLGGPELDRLAAE
jgi:hypothetical protein